MHRNSWRDGGRLARLDMSSIKLTGQKLTARHSVDCKLGKWTSICLLQIFFDLPGGLVSDTSLYDQPHLGHLPATLHCHVQSDGAATGGRMAMLLTVSVELALRMRPPEALLTRRR
jgi:hypothetical protein